MIDWTWRRRHRERELARMLARRSKETNVLMETLQVLSVVSWPGAFVIVGTVAATAYVLVELIRWFQ